MSQLFRTFVRPINIINVFAFILPHDGESVIVAVFCPQSSVSKVTTKRTHICYDSLDYFLFQITLELTLVT